MCKDYRCSFCGKEGVKLWRTDTEKFLICALCAEIRQSPMMIRKIVPMYVGRAPMPVERLVPLPHWKVNEKGRVPSSCFFDPSPYKLNWKMTNHLIINLKEAGFSSGRTTVVPAIPYENGENEFGADDSIPQDRVEWWENLPTR